MSQKLLLVALIGVLAGCSQPSTEPERITAVAPATAADCPQPMPERNGIQPLPKAVALPFAARLRSVGFTRTRAGNPRTRSVFEVTGSDAYETLAALGPAMEKAGFKPGSAKPNPAGATVATFGRKGYGVVRVTVRDGAGSKPSAPDVTSLVIFDFPGSDAAGASAD